MTIKTFFTVLAVLAVLFGIGFVLAPDQVVSAYGLEHSPAVTLMARLFGGSLLALGAILWLAKDFRDEAAMRAALIGSGIVDVVNLVVAVMGTLSGTMNALGWSAVLIYLYGAVGSAYFLMVRAQLR